jgi:hypothetical protein
MKLYFNGCSHTYGDDLEFQSKDAWPSVIGQMKNCDFVNFAVSGGTNDHIKYLTVKHVNDFDKFYIAWTNISRFTRYRSDNNHAVNFNVQYKHKLYGNDPEFKTYAKLHYKIWYNELYAFKTWLQDIVLLQRFLESHNKPYVMLNAFNNLIDRFTVDWQNFNNSVKSIVCFDLMDDQQLFLEHAEIQKLLGQINFENYIGWNTWWLTKMLLSYPVGPTEHLLEEGHLATAKYILEHDSN